MKEVKIKVERAPYEAMNHLVLALLGISPDSSEYDEKLKTLQTNSWKAFDEEFEEVIEAQKHPDDTKVTFL